MGDDGDGAEVFDELSAVVFGEEAAVEDDDLVFGVDAVDDFFHFDDGSWDLEFVEGVGELFAEAHEVGVAGGVEGDFVDY